MFVVNRADAGDNLGALVQVTQLKAGQSSTDMEQKVKSSNTKEFMIGFEHGLLTSDLDGVESSLSAELTRSADGQLLGLLPYVEQDNLYQFQVAAGDINDDGTIDILATAEQKGGVTLFMKIDAVNLNAGQKVQEATIVGTYEIYSVDLRGNVRRVDVGTLGIIAILIGL
jgi:hypothetical protein